MDPMSSFSLDSPGFVSLLTSQSVDFASSEQPPFSSQCSDEANSKGRRKWTVKEDLILVGAWLNTSKDPVVGNEQKAAAFWKRIADYFNANLQVVGEPPREGGQCKQRWSRINGDVCKFVGSYDMALRSKSSGQNDDDVLKAAFEIFDNDHGGKFTLEHAWRVLRNDQKWCSSVKAAKRKTVVDLSGEEEMEKEGRPIGVKAAKAAKRKKSGKEEAMSQLQSMLELKEKISKQKLLEILLTKSELTEIELNLKMKLLAEML